MRITELVAKLEAARAKHGDVPVALVDHPDGGFVDPCSFRVLTLHHVQEGYYDYAPWGGRTPPQLPVLTIW